jgi:hypothetical protein
MIVLDVDLWPSPVQAVMVASNLVLCALISWSCVCRISLMDARTTLRHFRLGYAALLVSSVSSGLSPLLWGEMAGPGQIGMALAILVMLGAGYGNWRNGVPDYATIPGALSEH